MGSKTAILYLFYKTLFLHVHTYLCIFIPYFPDKDLRIHVVKEDLFGADFIIHDYGQVT